MLSLVLLISRRRPITLSTLRSANCLDLFQTHLIPIRQGRVYNVT